MPKDLEKRLVDLFIQAESATFEDGMESIFSKEIINICYAQPAACLEILHKLINGNLYHPKVGSEVLKCLGHMFDPESRDLRRQFIESFLEHPSVEVRDGAILGISFLTDPLSIPALERAFARETNQYLKTDISVILLLLREL